MERIQSTAVFPSISPACLSEFKQVAQDLLDTVRQEPGTIQYDWSFNDDETQCVVRETFDNSGAVLTHMSNTGALVGRLVELGGGLRLDVFGDASEELRAALVGFDPPIYTF